MPAAAGRVAAVTRHDNVITLHFPASAATSPAPEDLHLWWPRMGEADVETASGKTPAAARAPQLPARWSPSPLRVIGDRFARSQCAADLRGWGWLVVFLIAALGCVSVFDEEIRGLVIALHSHYAGSTP